MEVMLPCSDNFNFDSACSSPYAPSTPKRFGEPNFYFSAPSSPTRASAFYNDFNNFSFNSSRRGHSSVIPYDWEEKPGTPKSQKPQNEEDQEPPTVEDVEESYDFEFGFSGQFDKDDTASITADADELFDGGKIKPLKPPPRLQLNSNQSNDFKAQKSNLSSPKSPRSPIAQGRKMIREAFSPKQRRKHQVDPFAVAIEQSRKAGIVEQQQERGRERVYSNFSSSASRKGSRSLSPYRSPPNFLQQQSTTTATTKASNTTTTTKSTSRKWSFRDFLLFRSASEGRAADRDPLRKFSLIKRNNDEVKNSSFRSTDSSGSGSMRRGRVSAHEQHYRSNRAVAEELKRKTVLPYKQGLFGWFRI
ncbi:hypothetical protein ACHQM5_024066 [Ranunculus cassubicifolius]